MANRSSIAFGSVPILFLFLSLCSHGLVSSTSDNGVKKLYIAYMGEKHHEDPEVVTSLHHATLSSLLESEEEALGSIVYSYRHGFSGFAATLTDSQAEKLAGMRGVMAVKLSQTVEASTTRSFDFLGLSYSNPPSQLLHKSRLGEDVIIGIIDSGIWPESRSFDDEGLGPVPARWKGICQTGDAFNSSHCNRKIIGARFYDKEVSQDVLREEYRSARDVNSHGTHVASTAAGSFVPNASDNGLATGWARGGAPHARLAVYKVLWGKTRSFGGQASILKAIDDAVSDGVDVLNLSLGTVEDDDTWLFPSLHAIKRGITVVYAGGNDGPYPQTITNASPWVITVAAAAMDRSFPTAVTLGNDRVLEGQALYLGNKDMNNMFFDIVYGFSCGQEWLNRTEIRGKVVLCNPGPASPRDKFEMGVQNVVKGGGLGIIFPTHTARLIEATKGPFPIVFVDWVVYQEILDYVATSRGSSVVSIAPTRTVEGKSVLAPRVADFSSRGPGRDFPAILKPDIAAPGVRILAAVGDSYQLMSGTSMAAPHVAGIAALLKSLHPTWSPAAIKSAIMTTASVLDNAGSPIVAEGIPRSLANPFDFGSGHIDPEKAADPGLVYDIKPEDFDLFNCSSIGLVICKTPQIPLSHLNLPSISIPDLITEATVPRTVTNVGSEVSSYDAVVEPPPGVQMQVHPSKLVFDEHTKTQKFTLTFTPSNKVQGVYRFGSLTWKNERHAVRIPIAVRPAIRDNFADIA